MSLSRRENVVLVGPTLALGASYDVTIYPVGGIVATTAASTTVTLEIGHGFIVGDKFLKNPGSDNTFSGTDTVQSVTATTIVMGNSTSVSAGDVLVNLGPDTDTGATPNYDGSPMQVYSDSDGGTALSNARTTASSSGEYSYYHKGDGRCWELIRDGDDDVVDVVKGFGGVSDRVNVYDFGAKGDGTTDDTTRIQAAINTGVGEIYIPGGTFIVNSDASAARTEGGIAPLSNSLLRLSTGATLKAAASSSSQGNVIRISSVSNVRIIGGTIDGNRAQWTGSGEFGFGIGIWGSSKINVSDIIIKNCWGDGIVIADNGSSECEHVRLYGVVSENNRRQGLSITAAIDVKVTACSFKDTNGTAPQAGIDIEPDSPYIAKDITIQGCDLDNNTGGGILVAITAATESANVSIVGNTFRDNDDSAVQFLTSGNETNVVCTGNSSFNDGHVANTRAAFWVFSTSGSVLISGNTIKDAVYAGIIVGGNSDRTQIIGNNIIDSGGQGIIVDNGSLPDNTLSGVQIVGNYVRRSAYNGIVLGFGATGCLVSSNYVESSGTAADSTYQNIVLSQGANKNTIVGNVCRAGVESNQADPGFEIVDGTSSTANNFVACNDFEGKTTGIRDQSVNNNILVGNYDRNLDGFQHSESLKTMDDTGTPSVKNHRMFTTGGTTAITDFDDGVLGQTISIVSAHSVTITNNASIIKLNGATNFAMAAGDTLTLTMFVDQVWSEVGRSDFTP